VVYNTFSEGIPIMEAREAIQVLTATVCRCQRGDMLNRALHSDRECEAVQALSAHISTTMLIEAEAQEVLNLARKPGAKPQPGCSHAQLIASVIEAYGQVSLGEQPKVTEVLAKP
jgi:hypothetical protein